MSAPSMAPTYPTSACNPSSQCLHPGLQGPSKYFRPCDAHSRKALHPVLLDIGPSYPFKYHLLQEAFLPFSFLA